MQMMKNLILKHDSNKCQINKIKRKNKQTNKKQTNKTPPPKQKTPHPNLTLKIFSNISIWENISERMTL